MFDFTGFILGFDPGGQGRPGSKGNFGWSICKEVGGCLSPPEPGKTGLARDAGDALDQVRNNLPANPPVLAAGIDAPLFWSKRGNRRVDCVLREALKEAGFPPGKVGGVVQAVNSLQGACLVQGILLASYLHETWPRLPITEAHPKALQYLLCHIGKSEMVQRLLTAGLVHHSHEWDATLAAVAAWAMRHRCNSPDWQDLYPQEHCPVRPFNTPVSYWMPVGPGCSA